MDLQRYLADEPVVACPPSRAYLLRKFLRRRQGPVVAAVLLALTLVIGATEAKELAVDEMDKKEAALAVAKASEQNAKDQHFAALLNQARAGRLARRMGQRLDGLAALTAAARIRIDDRLRDEAVAAMALPDVRVVPGWQSKAPIGAGRLQPQLPPLCAHG
jgi:hypothetical protein